MTPPKKTKLYEKLSLKIFRTNVQLHVTENNNNKTTKNYSFKGNKISVFCLQTTLPYFYGWLDNIRIN